MKRNQHVTARVQVRTEPALIEYCLAYSTHNQCVCSDNYGRERAIQMTLVPLLSYSTWDNPRAWSENISDCLRGRSRVNSSYLLSYLFSWRSTPSNVIPQYYNMELSHGDLYWRSEHQYHGGSCILAKLFCRCSFNSIIMLSLTIIVVTMCH